MPLITVSFTPKVITDWDPQKPLTTTKLNALYDNTEWLRQLLAGSYVAGAVQDHNHDGVNSASTPVGPNYARNGSFESGTAGYTVTTYTGATVGTSTANPLDGATSLAFTSTVLANGGGDALNNAYVECSEGEAYFVKGEILASVAGQSAKIEMYWYDKAKAQISVSTLYTTTSAPTALKHVGGVAVAPTNARYMRYRITGGIPATGTAVGTVYFDGLVHGMQPMLQVITGSLGANVYLGSAAYYDGPSVAQGAQGKWLVMGTVTITGSLSGDVLTAKLWDGTSVLDSADVMSSGGQVCIALSGYIDTPVGNLKITGKTSSNSGTAVIVFNDSGNSKDSTITAIRMG